jgi:hypothetical protein
MQRVRPFLSRALLALASAGLLAATSQADVLIVDEAGSGDFTLIQDAVNAATDGDIVLVHPGNYTGFLLTGKRLSIVAATGDQPVFLGAAELVDIPAPGAVVLSGLRVTAVEYADPDRRHGLRIINVDASVRLQHCTFAGADGPYGWAAQGGEGARVAGADDVVLSRCHLIGGKGSNRNSDLGPGGHGGPGLTADLSRISFFDSKLWGGTGGDTSDSGTDGGAGASIVSGDFFAAGSTFLGGAGGYSWEFAWEVGSGGDGLAVGASAAIALRDNQFTGGAGGEGEVLFGGPDGEPVLAEPGATVTYHPGSSTKVVGPEAAPDASHVAVQVLGDPGDRVWLPGAMSTSLTFKPGAFGAWILPSPVFMLRASQGVIPPSGILNLSVPLVALPPGVPADVRYYQGYVLSSQGGVHAGTPWTVVRLQ